MLLCVTESPNSFIKAARLVALKIDRSQGGLRSEKGIAVARSDRCTTTSQGELCDGNTKAKDKINPRDLATVKKERIPP